MKRRNFLIDFCFWVLAVVFGYTIAKEGDKLIIRRHYSSLLKSGDEKSVLQSLDGLYEKSMNEAFDPDDFILKSETTYTNAFSRIINEIKKIGTGSIRLAHNKEYEGDIIITTSNVTVKGEGILKGVIKIKGFKTSNNETSRYNGMRNININEICINGEGKRDGISIEYVYDVAVSQVLFKSCLKAVTVNSNNYTQHVSRLDILSNRFLNCQYSFFADKKGYSKYIVGDVTFSNNKDESTPESNLKRMMTFFGNGIDGAILNGNVMFGGSGTLKNILINNGNWISISTNNLFAPEQNCINIQNSKHVNISSGNNCAWPKKDAIFLENCTAFNITGNIISWYEMTGKGKSEYYGNGVVIRGNQLSYGNIGNNNIIFPYKSGVRLEGVGQTTVTTNIIRNLESTDEAIYADGEYNYIHGNTCIGFGKKNLIKGYKTIDKQNYIVSK